MSRFVTMTITKRQSRSVGENEEKGEWLDTFN